MARFIKTPLEKLITKINKLTSEPSVSEHNAKIKVRNKILFEFSSRKIKYTKRRYYPTKVDDLPEEYFSVSFPLNHDNLTLLSSNLINPPNGARKVIDLFRSISNTPFDHIEIGTPENKLVGNKIYITKELYETILKIDSEEGKDKKARFTARIAPFLRSNYSIVPSNVSVTRNYTLMLQELIASGEFTQADLITLSNKLEIGSTNQIVIQKQVNKQVKWLIDTIEELLEDTELNVTKVKDFGFDKFGYTKTSITGPEHLIEKILTDYGQNTFFGVPALLNTDKYVISTDSQSRSQFDLILITHLGDIEVVELKRTDETVLDYDSSRGKFYPSKSLSVAVAQAERYISAVNRDNDEGYLIDGKKIREYINEQVGGTTYIETVRPTALILIGSWQTLTKDYNSLSPETKQKVTKDYYHDNGLRTYREIKNSYKNIKLLTYSELLEHARTRLEIAKD